MLDFSKLSQMVPDTIKDKINSSVTKETRQTFNIRAFGLTKVPMLFIASPRVTKIDETTCEILIPLRKVVKNHLGSMYFGVLAMGADACAGMLAIDKIEASKKRVSLVFKDFQINFLKRAEADTRFVCEDGEIVANMVAETIATGERVNKTLSGKAFCLGEEVANFQITLSLKAH